MPYLLDKLALVNDVNGDRQKIPYPHSPECGRVAKIRILANAATGQKTAAARQGKMLQTDIAKVRGLGAPPVPG